MIIADTSAWIDMRRGNDRSSTRHLRQLLERGADVTLTEPIIMELLAGCRNDREVAATRRRLLGLPLARVRGLETYERAAAVERACVRAGQPVRSGMDCLIAAVAIREGATLLHADRDFEVIARHTELRIEPVGAR
ncbi:MAG: type II toxin-antitoxin system VapC family toxin [Actinomycetota bacterium]